MVSVPFPGILFLNIFKFDNLEEVARFRPLPGDLISQSLCELVDEERR